jgi:outer membrane protein assembly factor BamB
MTAVTRRYLARLTAPIVVSALSAVAVTGAATAGATTRTAASAAATPDWPAYLNGPRHTSYAPAQHAVTLTSVSRLVQAWHYGPGTDFLASPTVSGGAVYIGSNAGWFYRLSETTGAVLARRFTGYRGPETCGAMLGTVATATAAPDPVSHRATVYVAGANGYLYALAASNLAVRWKAVIALPAAKVSNYFDWSSPTVANGRVYVGVSSECDKPQIRGGVIAFSQATGKRLAEFYTVPRGHVGGSVWASVAVAADGDLMVSTGDGPAANQFLGYSAPWSSSTRARFASSGTSRCPPRRSARTATSAHRRSCSGATSGPAIRTASSTC